MAKRNTSGLKEYTEDLKRKKEQDVIKAINRLKKTGKPITLQLVCTEAKVSRSYIYKNQTLLTMINKYREPTGYKKIQSKDAKDTLILSLKAENTKLKRELKKLQKDESYKEKYEDALKTIESLKKQLNSAYQSNLNDRLNF